MKSHRKTEGVRKMENEQERERLWDKEGDKTDRHDI